MAEQKIIDAVKKAREQKVERKFKQTFDLAVNMKNMNMKKPENKIKAEFSLPHPFRDGKIGFIADTLVPQVNNLKDSNVILVKKDDLEALGRNKKAAKKLAKSCSGFIAEAPLMPLVGKTLGPILAPRNMMPQPIPPTIPDIRGLVAKKKNAIRVQLKDSPVIQLAVGGEEMEDAKVADNIETILNAVIAALPKGKEQLRNIMLKLTMSKPVKVVI